MTVLTEEMKKLVAGGRCMLATSGKDGCSNIGPKGSVMVLDDSTLAYGELIGKQSYQNVQENPKVAIAVAVVDFEKLSGYRFVGTAELEKEGELYEMFADRFVAMKLPNR